jgi:hypothetical protein
MAEGIRNRKEGEETGKCSHKAGLPIETISVITGLTPEKIKEIINK